MIVDDEDISTLPRNRRLKDIRKKKAKFDHAQFVAWDGEGITDTNGDHHYILLKSSLGHTLKTLPQIRTADALKLLTDAATENPKAIHVGYYLAYDFNMILQDLPIYSLQRIRKHQPVYYLHYSIRTKFGKELWIKNRKTGVSVTLWDVGSFYQQSFVSALEKWNIDVPFLQNIIENKAKRSVFTATDIDAIEEYCAQELEALVKLQTELHRALNICNLRINKWHGPGAIAAYLFKHHNIRSHMVTPPDNVNAAAQSAYGGGRIELIRQGHHDDRTYYYDIRSAYPYGISRLPSLRYGQWRLSTVPEPELRELSLYHVANWDFNGMDTFYPIRCRDTHGNITYPERGTGVWVWTPEYAILREHYAGRFETSASLIFDNQQPSLRPFVWVEHLYDTRREWKANGNPAQEGLKLGLNSIYGKMIQQLGWSIDANGNVKLPAYHQLEYGGYVTSECRAQLFRAAMGNADRIIGFETDGIITTDPLDVPLSHAIGGWECDLYDSITYVQNGFYFLNGERGGKTKFRGFDKGSITEDMILNAWANGDEYVEARLTRHYGLHAALHQNRLDQWGNWLTEPRNLSVNLPPTKRIARCDRSYCNGCALGKGKHQVLHDTDAYGWATEESAPYPLEWKGPIPDWKRDIDLFNRTELCDYESMDMA